MIVAAPEIVCSVDDRCPAGGHQLRGRIDLLALAPDGALILIELKRGRTSRDVVAKAIDYAPWAESLTAEEIACIYAPFSSGGNLTTYFRTRFGLELEETMLNVTHQIVIVAASLDATSERLVGHFN